MVAVDLPEPGKDALVVDGIIVAAEEELTGAAACLQAPGLRRVGILPDGEPGGELPGGGAGIRAVLHQKVGRKAGIQAGDFRHLEANGAEELGKVGAAGVEIRPVALRGALPPDGALQGGEILRKMRTHVFPQGL